MDFRTRCSSLQMGYLDASEGRTAPVQRIRLVPASAGKCVTVLANKGTKRVPRIIELADCLAQQVTMPETQATGRATSSQGCRPRIL